MRYIPPYSLWLGNAGDVGDLREVLAAEICAVIAVALNEPAAVIPRELLYCRFPLADGAGNPPWLLKAAIEMTAGLLRQGVPTLVCCSAGMSRSPAVAAGALSLISDQSPDTCLAMVSKSGPCDVSPGLWRDIQAVLRSDDTGASSARY